MSATRRSAIILPSEPLAAYVDKGEVKARYFNPDAMFDHVCVIQEEPGVPQAFFGDATVTEIVAPLGQIDIDRVWEACPDATLVRGYGFDDQAAAAVRIGRALALPTIVSAHIPPITYARLDLRHSRSWRRIGVLPAMLRWSRTMRQADAVICVSTFVAREVRTLAPHTRIELNYNRVDPAFVAPARTRTGPRLRLLTIGRLYPTKNQAVILRAVARVPEIDLILVGRGPLRDELRALATTLGIADRVEWIPAVPHRDLPALYARADAFTMASEGEGFCTVVLEAMSGSLPVILPRREPFVELADSAAVYTDGTVDSFAAAFGSMLDERRRGAAAARSWSRAREVNSAWSEAREAALVRSIVADEGPSWRGDLHRVLRRRFTPLRGGRIVAELPRIAADVVDGEEATRYLPVLAHAAGLGTNDRILDVGSGFGAFVAAAAAAGFATTGLEPSVEDRVFADRRMSGGHQKAEIAAGVAERLPFPDASFELVTLFNTLEHVDDPERAIAEAARVCTSGGHVFVLAPDYGSCLREPHYQVAWLPRLPRGVYRLYLRLRRRDPAMLDSLRLITLAEVKSAAARAGLREVRSFNDSPTKWDRPDGIQRRWLRVLVRAMILAHVAGVARRLHRRVPRGAIELLLVKP